MHNLRFKGSANIKAIEKRAIVTDKNKIFKKLKESGSISLINILCNDAVRISRNN